MVSLVSLYDDPFGYPSCLELAKNPKNRKNRWCSDGHRPLSQLPRHSGQATEGISYQAGTKKKISGFGSFVLGIFKDESHGHGSTTCMDSYRWSNHLSAVFKEEIRFPLAQDRSKDLPLRSRVFWPRYRTSLALMLMCLLTLGPWGGPVIPCRRW
jgi:hypothetical protein